jgi:DNA-binding beta-propeller fold protein YncE/mono/diheme cytochrome c family protein
LNVFPRVLSLALLCAAVGCSGGPADSGSESDGDTDDGGPSVRDVVIPLGETLFLGGDDYLSFWGVGDPAAVELVRGPEGATAEIIDGRLTPDVTGAWELRKDGEKITVHVDADYLNEDTFLNYNYTPVQPLLAYDAQTLWVASPPSNAIQEVLVAADGSLSQGRLVATGSWPVALARWGELILVAQAGRDSVALVDPALGIVVDAIEVGDEPATIVVDGDVAYVALGGRGQVAKLDLSGRTVVGRVDVGRKTRALALDAARGRLFAASLISSNGHPQGLLQGAPIPAVEQRDVAVIDTATFEVESWIHAVGTILRGLYVDGDRLLVSVSHSRNDIAGVEADSRPHAYALAVVDIADGSASQFEVVQEVDLDLQASSTGPAPSPFSITRTSARNGSDEVIVSLSAGHKLLVLDAATFAEKARLETGNDPRGLAFFGDQVLTYAWLDNEVVRFAGDAEFQRLEVGRDPTPPRIKDGQRIFNDATFSRNGDFSCNNCHIDGVTDGLVWNILLDGDVNTLAFRNVSGTGPFLWGGQLPTLFDFSREVLRLVGASATGEEMEKLTEYMQSVTAPPNPYTLPGGRLDEAQLRGRELFYGKANCGTCHAGPLFTSGEMASPGKTNKPTDVPSLVATYDSGPWGREAQWTSLGAMVDFAADYAGATLSAEERADLLSYVEALPGDVLYLNASAPQGGSANVFSGVAPELTFSSILAPDQEGAFTFETEAGGSWEAVAGTWTTRGRVARFEPDAPLANTTSYRMRVAEGLEGAHGRQSAGELVVDFATGEVALTDVSGPWRLDISGMVSGSVDLAFLQATGGKVTGALLQANGDIEFDNVQGYVAGNTLYVDSFLADTLYGEVLVDSIEVDLVDADNDGYAESGNGTLYSIVTLSVAATRLALPGG